MVFGDFGDNNSDFHLFDTKTKSVCIDTLVTKVCRNIDQRRYRHQGHDIMDRGDHARKDEQTYTDATMNDTKHNNWCNISGPKIVFSDTKCAVGNSECVVGICLMCSSIFSNEMVQHDRF